MASEAKEKHLAEVFHDIKQSILDLANRVHDENIQAAFRLSAAEKRAYETEMQNKQIRESLTAAREKCKALEESRAEFETRFNSLKTNTSVKLGEFAKLFGIIEGEADRLGIVWHGTASTMLKAILTTLTQDNASLRAELEEAQACAVKPGDVLFRPTGETRVPQHGDCVDDEEGGFLVINGNNCEEPNAIYRRIEYPAAASVSQEQASATGSPTILSGKARGVRAR